MPGILSDTEILKSVDNGDIVIDPFNSEHVNITSYDLTLGGQVCVYKEWVHLSRKPHVVPGEWGPPSVGDGSDLYAKDNQVLDVKKPQELVSFQIPETGFILRPGIGYLMHTAERVHTKKFNPILDGKSSIGRLFIQVHATAGYGDPGFDGQYTLEVLVLHPVKVYAGMRFCQIRFHTIAGELSRTYDQVGHYTKGSAQGAVASQAWTQFEED
jgi:dCTP deaminase